MMQREAKARTRWVVDVRNKANGATISSRYYENEWDARGGFLRASSRHAHLKLVEVRIYQTDVRLPT